MEHYSRGLRVQVFLGESDQVGHTPREGRLLGMVDRAELLRAAGDALRELGQGAPSDDDDDDD